MSWDPRREYIVQFYGVMDNLGCFEHFAFSSILSGTTMEEDYKCGKCDTWTVSLSQDWGVPCNSYDEIMYDIYTCSKCQSECSSPSRDKEYKDGNTIYF